jgi:hypothetical protein
MFSFYKKPISNLTPYRDISIDDLFLIIKNDYFKKETGKARSLYKINKNQYRQFKATAFNYVTFAGSFSKRDSKSLKTLSGLMCLDVDHTHLLTALKKHLINDEFLKPVLIFTSPSGDGLKVVIHNPNPDTDYKKSYELVRSYFFTMYGRKLDSTSDIARACFICHDPDVWVRNYLIPHEQYINGLHIEEGNIICAEGYPATWDITSPYLEERTKNVLKMILINPDIFYAIKKLDLKIL